MRSELARIVRFGLVGATNTAVTFASYAVLTAAGLAAPAASAVAFGLGALNGYRLNRAFTFRGAAGGLATLARYAAVQGAGAALSSAGVAIATAGVVAGRLEAEAIVLPIVTLFTYVLVRRHVFTAPAGGAW